MYKLIFDSIERYEILNEALQENDIKHIEVIVIGGEAGKVILGEDEFRGTIDIDFYSEYMLGKKTIDIMNDLGFDVVQVLEVPPPEDINHVYTYKLSNLTIHYPSVEDFALSKLMTQRERDHQDLLYYPILDKCDLNLVQEKINEYKDYLLNPDSMNWNYMNFDMYIKKRGLK